MTSFRRVLTLFTAWASVSFTLAVVLASALTLGWSLVTGKNLRLKLSATKTACSGSFSSSCSPAPFRPDIPEPERLCFPPLLAMFNTQVLKQQLCRQTEVDYGSRDRTRANLPGASTFVAQWIRENRWGEGLHLLFLHWRGIIWCSKRDSNQTIDKLVHTYKHVTDRNYFHELSVITFVNQSPMY